MTIICIIIGVVLAAVILGIAEAWVSSGVEDCWHRSNLGKWEQYSGKKWGDE